MRSDLDQEFSLIWFNIKMGVGYWGLEHWCVCVFGMKKKCFKSNERGILKTENYDLSWGEDFCLVNFARARSDRGVCA